MRRLLPLLLAVLPACADGLFSPSDELLDIELERQSVTETTLLVGEVLTLTIRSRGGDGERTAWRTTDARIATVNGDGEVRGVGFGSASVIAARGGLEDTVHVSVLDRPMADGYCGSGGLVLERGGSLTTTAGAAADLCIRGGDRSQIYVLVPFHAAAEGSALRVEVAAEGVGDGTFLRQVDGPAFNLPAATVPAPLTTLRPSQEFDRALREREALQLAPLVGGRIGRETSAPTRPAFAAAPTIGDTLTLNVNPLRTCSEPWHRRVRIAAVSDRAIILHDELNPVDGFTHAEYLQFAETFDDVVYPTVASNFGEPTDIDGNGRVLIVFTSAVNQLTEPRSMEYVAGFFYARDLFPRSNGPQLGSCAASNTAELIYMMAPDPSGQINRNVRTKRFVSERTPAVLGHELQHLISASRRLRVVEADEWNEEFWLNEGLSHIAEELLFYATSGAPQRRELNGSVVRGLYWDAYDRYQAVNVGRYTAFLRDPGGAAAFNGTDLATRGASWSFLRYVADRLGGDEADLWRRMIDSNRIGYANLANAMGTSPLTWMHDWAVSLYTDDLVTVPARFRQPSWNFRSVLPTLASGVATYPLKIDHVLMRSPSYGGTLIPGGAAVLRFSIPARGTARLRTTSGGSAPPDDLRLTLIRTF